MDILFTDGVKSTWKERVTSSRSVRRAVGAATSGRREEKKTVQSSTPGLYREKLGKDAQKAWARTLQFRKEHGASEALERPQTQFEAVHGAYPHYVYGKVKDRVVLVELVGRIDGSRLASLDVGDVVRHYVFFHEYLSRRFDGEETRLVSILDLEGLKFSALTKNALRLIAAATDVAERMVPCRQDRVFLRNAPSWLALVIGTLPLPKKLNITVASSDDDFKAYIPDGFPSPHELEARPDHAQLVALVRRKLGLPQPTSVPTIAPTAQPSHTPTAEVGVVEGWPRQQEDVFFDALTYDSLDDDLDVFYDARSSDSSHSDESDDDDSVVHDLPRARLVSDHLVCVSRGTSWWWDEVFSPSSGAWLGVGLHHLASASS